MVATELSGDDVTGMLRDSLRGFLDEHWRTRGQAASASPEEVAAIWRRLVGQGVATLGTEGGEGGLAEILVVMAELGRAGCPAPMWSVALANLAVSGSQIAAAADLLKRLHSGKAIVAFSFAALDPIPARARSRLRASTQQECSASSRLRQARRISWSLSISLVLR
ncbi:acyl-CoA dehydrogenase family protein [Bradyrhizobium sp. 2S1]|uniref:acyl-CoA dehydrogenase family protein n=1 Tax=Bradyrhizobium sp. 2S1 TaxID=1404429 RepID=UPI001CD16E5E|nr:acyl-CoA dehydrogenase family protein [Bradyrhizobium sp. 2S1]MCK7671079.1 acyl-CoA dehydrogenase family protein [Bradyrhizobium sp. 2S1]